jgi:hypothetical protein
MDRHEIFSTNKAPLFDGSNYALWSIRMKHYFSTLGFDVWSTVKNGYTTLETPHVDTIGKRINDNKSKAMGTIMNDLVDSIFVKVMHCTSAKEM